MAKSKEELKEILKEIKSNPSNKGMKVFALQTFIDEDDNESRTIFLKKPNRMIRSAAEKVMKTDTYKGIETFLRGMYLGGDDLEEILKNDDAFMIAGESIIEIVEIKKGNVSRV